jgi:hypothetical protein
MGGTQSNGVTTKKFPETDKTTLATTNLAKMAPRHDVVKIA